MRMRVLYLSRGIDIEIDVGRGVIDARIRVIDVGMGVIDIGYTMVWVYHKGTDNLERLKLKRHLSINFCYHYRHAVNPRAYTLPHTRQRRPICSVTPHANAPTYNYACPYAHPWIHT